MTQFQNPKPRSGICQKSRLIIPRFSLLLAMFASPIMANFTFAQEQEIEFPDLKIEANYKNLVEEHNNDKDKKKPWPEGLDSYKIRFIRLQHDGQGWDDGMRATNADVNLLQHFAKSTGIDQVASKSESHRIGLLAKYPRDGFPPFVFLTGNHKMGRISQKDMKVLREYCLGGGLLIADAGSPQFHQSFIHLMRMVFPGKKMLDIADDDTLYQKPFAFPDGAPAFWGHGGRRALGIKHEGRWVVFYHPGDMNDAWKNEGYTDVTPEMKESALNLGVNLLLYSFESWDLAIAKAIK